MAIDTGADLAVRDHRAAEAVGAVAVIIAAENENSTASLDRTERKWFVAAENWLVFPSLVHFFMVICRFRKLFLVGFSLFIVHFMGESFSFS